MPILLILKILAAVILTLGCLYWVANAYGAVRLVRGVRGLVEQHPAPPARWPKVSVIVPACNEARMLEEAMRSRLADTYPDMEVILIDDRSTDDTPAIVDRLAAADPRVRAMHITELPAGWLGKNYALHRGAQLARGEWLLFSDADVHVAPGTLEKAVAYAEEGGLDLLGILPGMRSTSFLLDIALATFIRTFCVSARLWEVNNPKSSAAMGIGAFNLVRRSSFERTEGFPWLALDPGDDAALGLLMKRAGMRCAILGGREHLEVTWYHTLPEMIVGLERSSFSAFGHYSLAWNLFLGLAFLDGELAPFLALLPLGIPGLQLLGLGASLLALATAAGISAWTKRPLLPALLAPVGSLLMGLLLLRAGILGHLRGGIIWRGTLYPTSVLREGVRVKLPL
ncbi:MAG: glycosyltransferase family 2 protein [Armatimonadota bacterium]